MNEFRIFAHGEEFNIDAFLETTTLRPDYVWRRGDLRRYSCIGSTHPTSGVEFVLGDGRVVPFLEQEEIAIAYLKAHRNELVVLAQFAGVETFNLGLQYVCELTKNTLGFCIGPSDLLMAHALDVGVSPTYYVTLDRRQGRNKEESEPGVPPGHCSS